MTPANHEALPSSRRFPTDENADAPAALLDPLRDQEPLTIRSGEKSACGAELTADSERRVENRGAARIELTDPLFRAPGAHADAYRCIYVRDMDQVEFRTLATPRPAPTLGCSSLY